jgi:hypothetical protein
MIQEEITTQALEVLTEKAMQVHARVRELADKFHSLAEVVQGAHNARVARDEPHVSFGGLLGAGIL